MAKSTNQTIKAIRNGIEREFSKAQWDSMKANKGMYGWKATSNISDEVIKKEAEITAKPKKTKKK